MSDLVVLSLPWWATNRFTSRDLEHHKACEPVYNRPGHYIRRKEGKSWIELPDGRAFLMDFPQDRFNLELDYWRHHPDRTRILYALRVFQENGLLTTRQKKVLYMAQLAADCVRTAESTRDVRLRMYKFKKGLKR